MEKSQLAQMVQTFSEPEKKEIKRFLESPFFNRREDVVFLFDWFCRETEPHKVTAKTILFGESETDDQELRLRMTYLMRHLEEYVAVKTFLAGQWDSRVYLAAGLRRRGMAQPFLRTKKSLEKKLEAQTVRDADFFQWQYRLEWEAHQQEYPQQPTEVGHLLAAAEAADVAYLLQRLRILCLLKAHGTVYQSEGQTGWEAEVLAYAETRYAQKHTAVGVYLACYHMLDNPDAEQPFLDFKQQLLGNAAIFREEEMHPLYMLALNFCIRRINAGQAGYFHEALELYKAGLDLGFLFENGQLTRYTYFNIAAAGIQTGDLEWVRFFINEYKGLVEKKHRESAFSFNLARLEYASRHYGHVLELLQHANYRDPLLNLAAKTLLLKTYYDLGEYDLLQSHLDAMRNYVQRKRVIGYHRTNYLNIIRYTEKLLRLNPMDKAAVSVLKKSVEAEAVLTEKGFLMGKLGGN